ncbi:alpha-(1,3)-fucosyltransferase C [Amyelois transitella]|uniref:alpha-(1,3)-fucosyltransferase C n=1 Tax=Amyelois transitella TaxID=680683 RepID=UPI00298F6DD5|nr:alpha-(1,3)-fucosyltransferase C [Amyelois transitella]
MSHGRTEFSKLRCPSHNCYVTLNRSLFKDIRDFDVIAFNGKDLTEDDLPQKRAKYQKYIFFNMDSSANHPVDENIFDGFFNATATYRLDSDIPLPHLLIKDTEGNEIGPQKEMYWVPEEEVDHKLVSTSILKRKDRAAAVYLSTCRTLSGREQLVANLQKELKLFGLAVDVYGPCGPFKCSKNVEKCRQKMTKTYYFYLAFENSLDRDYVTGKLLVALQNYVVPIVFGGANYSRFLPPGSYLDAMRHSPANLAKTIEDLLSYPNKYLQYFWWKKFYTYHNPKVRENICNICATMGLRWY